MHGAFEPSPGVGIVATTRNRTTLRFADRNATVSFVRRDPRRLKIERYSSQLGAGWMTTVEQTLLDRAPYPQLSGRPDLADDAITGCSTRSTRMCSTAWHRPSGGTARWTGDPSWTAHPRLHLRGFSR
jgi:hypothetical protein